MALGVLGLLRGTSFAIIPPGKKELVVLLFFLDATSLLLLFLTVPWVDLWCAVVAFPGHTHLLFVFCLV